MMIEPRFDHVGINVADLDASIAFLKTMFGFEMIQKWDSPRQAFVGNGSVVLGVIEKKDYDFTLQTMAHIAFPCRKEEFPSVVARVQRMGAPIVSGPKLVCLENTHNRGGGTIWPLERISEVADFARRQSLAMHLDGARLWNASVATGIAERDYAAPFDSVSVCFSKGLGAPIGSVLCGSRDFIQRARRFRKMFGGGMRQVGILAAGALYALEHQRSRLADDHANARALAQGLARLPGIELDSATIQTNIVFFNVETMPAKELVQRLDRAGVRMLALGPNSIRAVTNLMVTAEEIPKAVEIVGRVMQTC